MTTRSIQDPTGTAACHAIHPRAGRAHAAALRILHRRARAHRAIVAEMAGNVVNLNRFKKKQARAQKEKQAEINRVRHGRTKAEKLRDLAEQQRAARLLDGKRLEPANDSAVIESAPETVLDEPPANDSVVQRDE